MAEPQGQMSNVAEWSVSELSASLKRALEERFGHVRVRGEISGLKRAASGHVYLSLKDDKAVLDAVIWRTSAAGLSFRPEDGLEVVATGRITTYAGRSKYQIVVEQLEPAGVGALMALLEERKKKLAAEGLFDPERKRPLPFLPRSIGVVTSPTGAVIRDILHRLAERFPRDVLIWPVLVQGEGAAEQIAAAVRGFNALPGVGPLARPDVLIVARGGGSIEDLWAFNEEVVVRAVADSAIPVISAVGHETDTTLVDYVSDRRAPTPSAAAEMAVPVLADLRYAFGEVDLRFARALQRFLGLLAERLAGLVRGLPRLRDFIALASQRYDDCAERLDQAARGLVRGQRERYQGVARGLNKQLLLRALTEMRLPLEAEGRNLERAMQAFLREQGTALERESRLLATLSYQSVLKRGYAVVRDASQRPLTRAGEIKAGDVLDIEFQDGHQPAVAGGRPRRSRKTPADAPAQGKLL